MKEQYRDVNFRPKTEELLSKILSVVQEFQRLGYKLTLRQLYYQLVAKDIIQNTPQSYSKLSTILVDARMGGLVDWDAIEDRVRVPEKHSEWESIADVVESAIYAFRLPRWGPQVYYVELWSEKDALASVLKPITEKYHITLMINRGYSSASAMYKASDRYNHMERIGKQVVLLYLGDHDPSGLDMDRDIEDRLHEFRVYGIEVERIGLTMKQIEEYSPPPNPAKVTDPRARGYIKEFGEQSWEVDALKPQVLDKLVSDAIEQYLDKDTYDAVIEKEDELKDKLRKHARMIENEEEGDSS